MSLLSLSLFALLGSMTLAMASVRIESADMARGYLDRIFTESGCRMRFAEIDNRMRADGIIPTATEMQSQIGVTKFIRQRRVMGALNTLFETGAVCADPDDALTVISEFGGCA